MEDSEVVLVAALVAAPEASVAAAPLEACTEAAGVTAVMEATAEAVPAAMQVQWVPVVGSVRMAECPHQAHTVQGPTGAMAATVATAAVSPAVQEASRVVPASVVQVLWVADYQQVLPWEARLEVP